MAAKKKAKKKTVKKKAVKRITIAQARVAAKKKLVLTQKKAHAELARLKKKFLAAEKKAKNMIKNNPEKAVIIAAGVGTAIGSSIVAAVKRVNKKPKKKR